MMLNAAARKAMRERVEQHWKHSHPVLANEILLALNDLDQALAEIDQLNDRLEKCNAKFVRLELGHV